MANRDEGLLERLMMTRQCDNCDFFFSNFCDLYERGVDEYECCDDYANLESFYFADASWDEEEDSYPD